MCDVPNVNLTDPISSGPWTLYFHQGDSDKWTLDTFVKVQTCNTWSDVLQALEEVGHYLYGKITRIFAEEVIV